MTKSVAKSASRGLGFLICKDKALGGMPFECFTKCYNSLVQPVIDYGSSVWGTNGYSCVETVQYRACRYFLGLGKYAPTPAVSGDMGWLAPRHKQWLGVMRKWLRVLSMDNSFLTKKIFLHSMNQSNSSCRTWFYRVKQFLISIDQEHMFRARDLNARLVLPVINANLKMFYDKCWQEKIQAESAVRGETHGGNKLRTYRLTFKNTYSTEPYVCNSTKEIQISVCQI